MYFKIVKNFSNKLIYTCIKYYFIFRRESLRFLKAIPHQLTNPCFVSRSFSDVQRLGRIVWVSCHMNLNRLFNTKFIFIQINSSISNNSV